MSNPIVDSEGNKRWFNSEGQFHRLDGPAIEGWDGYKAWFVDGKLHRLDGPAYEWADGNKDWWVDGFRVNEAKYPQAVLDYTTKKNTRYIKIKSYLKIYFFVPEVLLPLSFITIFFFIYSYCNKVEDNFNKYNTCIKVASKDKCKHLYFPEEVKEEQRILDLVKKDLEKSQ